MTDCSKNGSVPAFLSTQSLVLLSVHVTRKIRLNVFISNVFILSSSVYADDIVLIATSQSDLQELVDQLDRASQKYRVEINIDKTKIMETQDIINNITINGTSVEKVESLTFLGSLFTQEAECDEDIRKS